jgi:hypothetical protein
MTVPEHFPNIEPNDAASLLVPYPGVQNTKPLLQFASEQKKGSDEYSPLPFPSGQPVFPGRFYLTSVIVLVAEDVPVRTR